ncbi:LacI family DNA-binding transcriptional regulator [Micromonospora craniellae]|uniref:LacI family DNA-binding transcriptional regulator n=1 Tax=Micromonospora craniellae TaxID=2294034 RepID=A0A372G1Z7_9ACTN|nr:LacI family DNA-binding transcriptional regulator [Micromonospora craniellae]QOC91937.1 LacI family DNA-binding transcriptional regulator [Micromonospora craniellae]RFS46769.1 LacI family DNA-binding transcriptional regulator [Micromonospora craniellae]
MKPTLKAVAEAVGVSRSTVSNAYGRPDQLSTELRERILETARQMGYPGPDPTARSLRRGVVGAIGVLFTSRLSYAFTDPFAVRFVTGVAEAAERHDSNLLLVPLPPDASGARRAVENAAVDGFCVYCVGDEEGILAAIRGRGLPFVTTSARSGADDRWVGIDERAAARSAAAHLVELGHRRVALLGHDVLPRAASDLLRVADVADVPHPTTRDRFAGFADAFATAGVPWSDLTVLTARDNTRDAGAAATSALASLPEPPTAVLAASDVLAFGALDALREQGEWGRQVSVTGFDDIAEAATVGLTTVRQPAEQKGRTAAELLLEPPADARAGQILLPTTLVVRTSSGPVPRS